MPHHRFLSLVITGYAYISKEGQAFRVNVVEEQPLIAIKSTHSTPGSEARGMLRVDTERRFLPQFKNRGLAPSNVSMNRLNAPAMLDDLV
jgi:hypothetical protein